MVHRQLPGSSHSASPALCAAWVPLAFWPVPAALNAYLSRTTVCPPQFLSASRGTEQPLGPETCLYPGPKLASITKKLCWRNYGAGQPTSLNGPAPLTCTPFSGSGKLESPPTLTRTTTHTQTELERRPAATEVKTWLRSKAEAEATAAAEAKTIQRLTEIQTKLDSLPKTVREESKACELQLEHRLTAAAATSVDGKLSAMHRALADDVQVRWEETSHTRAGCCLLCGVGGLTVRGVAKPQQR